MNKKVDVLLGLQWGDEGKGKVVDVLTPHYDMIARFQGGPNAGHTLEFDDKKFVLRSIPSGIFQGGKTNLIGNGVVLDPVLFRQEAEELMTSGIDIRPQLVISKKAHLILPTLRMLDAANEASKGAAKIGTTGKGIGPTYTDKISRNGIRVGDVLHADFRDRFDQAKQRHARMLTSLTGDADPLGTEEYRRMEADFMDAVEYLKSYRIVDSEYLVNDALQSGQTILAEGAQGSLLDVDFGSYPFVTSSNTVAAGCCTGLGIAPSRVGRVYGIFKAYCTRVGAGPFPTELDDANGHAMAERGFEFGAVTGRKRRCGWIDLVALKYTTILSGVTDLIMMKSDVLDTFDEIKACVSYEIDGKHTNHFPFEVDSSITPEYKSFKGWKTDLTKMRSEEELPEEFMAYVRFIEEYLGVPITILSVGPDRTETILRDGFVYKH